MSRTPARSRFVILMLGVVLVALAGCGADRPTNTPAPTLAPSATPTERPTRAPTATATAAPTVEPTAAPSELLVEWGEWWYEGEYMAATDKYPSDPVYHDRSFNVRVRIQNASDRTLPGDVLPLFFLAGEEAGSRIVTTWYYSQDDLRPLQPGEKKEAVFRALTYAPGQWISRAELRWRGQVWAKDFPKR